MAKRKPITSRPDQNGPGLSRPTAIAAAFLALHVLLAYWRPLPFWGADLLAYYPAWVQGLFAVAGVLLLIPAVRQRLIDSIAKLPSAVNPWNAPRSFYLFTFLLAIAGGLAFITLRSAVHFLGDGYLLLRDLPLFLAQDTWKGVNAPLSYWAIAMLNQFGPPLWNTPEATYRIFSYTSGILYLLLSLPAARSLGRTSLERTLILSFLLTPGFLQLFFGYVETYAFLLPAILLYLLISVQVLRDRLSLWMPALLLGLLIPLHLTLVSFIPSLLVLAFLHTRTKCEADPQPSRWRTMLKTFALLGACPFLVLILFTLIDFDLFVYLKTAKGSHLLPLFTDPGFMHPYRFISPSHLLDLFNHYLLVAPSALMVLCLLKRGESSPDPVRTFLLAAALFPILFTLLANPGIGAFRDWDAFAYPALPLTLWAVLALIGRVRERIRLMHIGFLICVASALHSLLWIGLNASPTSAEARFADLLGRCRLSAQARSYGWETLGDYYRSQNQNKQAAGAYQQALAASPKNPRHWSAIGMMYHKSGQIETAIQYYQKAIALKPDLAKAYSNMGNAYSDLGQHETALQHYRKVIALNPNFADVYYNMGNTYYDLGRIETAIEHFQKALSFNPDHAKAHYNIGALYYNTRKYETAIEHFQKAITAKPDFADAYLNLGGAYSKLGQHGKALQHYRKVLALNPNDAHAYFNMGVAYPIVRPLLSSNFAIIPQFLVLGRFFNQI